MPEGEGVDAVVGFVFGGAVVEEAADETALLELLEGFGRGKREEGKGGLRILHIGQ